MTYRKPGVYVKEISVVPSSVAEVETAIPAFIGYTEKAEEKGEGLTNKPKRIKSLVEFEQFFGGPARPNTLKVTLDAANTPTKVAIDNHYQMYYSLRLFYDNGGGDCYIVSVGSVGQPRDHDPRASFTIYDTDRGLFEFKRVEYDVNSTAQRIFDNKRLSDSFGARLFAGV